MEQREEQIRRFLETFFKATQIEAIYFDRQMNTICNHYQKSLAEDLPRLSMGRVETYLEEIFSKGGNTPENFYTCYLHHNLVCNIAILSDDGGCCGAAVTQPVALCILKKCDIEAKLDGFTLIPAERDKYIAALLRSPVVAYDRIVPMGEVLSSLSRTVFEATGFHQVLCGEEAASARYRLLQSGKSFNPKHTALYANSHGGYPVYLKIKESITKGDTEALLKVLATLNPGCIHLDQHSSKDTIRSLKNSFIEGCAMCCFIAIEAGVSYHKARELTEAFIKDLESTDSIIDMYALMRSALLAFTRAVAVMRITGYSKPVRLVMEYIETHYAEKITLKKLAQQAKLSESYLSNLIKKETGLNITEIISKVRIEESRKILLKSTVSINELATMVGYKYSSHFSRVFKQYTGMAPSEYIKMITSSSDDDSEAKDILRMLLDQLCHAMSMFPGIFDIGRIVDPASNVAWMMQPSREIIEGTCYDFWNRKQSCQHCISHTALEQDKAFVKLDQATGNPFFVFSAPVAVGSKKYVVELLKSISDNYVDCTKKSLATM